MSNRVYTFDALQQLADGAQNAGHAQLLAAARTLDLGGAQIDSMLMLNVLSIDVSSGDERYQIIVQGSNSVTFASGIENLATLDLGVAGARAAGAKASSIGMHQIGIVNEAEDTVYRYLRLYNLFSGTTPAVSYNAWLANPAGR